MISLQGANHRAPSPVAKLNSEQLSSLAIALLSFDKMADFDRWLESNGIEVV
jgi:Domain of unknown function (DUF4351)